MNKRLHSDAWCPTPTPRFQWRRMTNEERLHAADIGFNQITVKHASADGQVIVELWDALPASMRGEVLLDYEECLKQAIDPALTVWLEPMGDRNSLRKLRGVEVEA